jgi:hypothetical protein
MKIYTALQIGEYHLNHCEDYLFVGEIGNDKLLCAVMDGCTMATDSYFASTLVGKLLRKIAKEKGYKELYEKDASTIDIDDYLKAIVSHLFNELIVAKNQLQLERNELLTTLIILLFDKKLNEGIVLAIGDGLININGIITEFDQDNKPDYIGFHLSEDFDSWYKNQTQKIRFNQLKDVSIATDGILTFTKTALPKSAEIIDPIIFLMIDKTNTANEEMLQLKLKKLEHEFGLQPTDDLAIIRLISADN